MKHNKQAWTIAVLFLASFGFAQINNGGSGGGGSGTVGNCTAAGNAYYPASGTTTTCDTSVTDNGSGQVNMKVIGLTGATSGTSTLTPPAVAGTSTNPIVSTNTLQLPRGTSGASGQSINFGDLTTGVFSSGANTLDLIGGGGRVQLAATATFISQPLCDFNVGNNCLTFAPALISATGAGNPIIHSTNNTKAVGTSDFTSANSAALQAITGLSFPLGSTAQVFTFHCALMYSQATNVAGDQFGVGVITTAPTNVNVTSGVFTNATAVQGGSLNGLATTTPTAVVTFQPGVTTVLGATLDGTIETAGGGAATFNAYVLNGTAADVIVVKRGSYCTIY